MKTISVGDVYYAKSPILSEDQALVRKMTNALGLFTARPVLILRAPMDWDTFSTVTVIPSFNDTDPCIAINMEGRFGEDCNTTFNFIPHLIHTIPIKRLTRYMGHLDIDELNTIRRSVKWIMGGDEYQAKKNPPICFYPNYLDSINKNHKELPNVSVDNDGRVRIDGSVPVRTEEPSIAAKASYIANTFTAVSTSKPKPESKEEKVKIEERKQKPRNTNFPTSIFNREDLLEVADRFDIDPSFYDDHNDHLKRSIELLTPEELETLFEGLSQQSRSLILTVYDKMHSVDAIIFGPHLPTSVLARLCFMNHQETIALKKICSKLKDMSPEEMEERSLQMLEIPEIPPMELPVEEEKPEEPVDPYPLYITSADIKRAINQLRPYLNDSSFSRIPKNQYEAFIRTPVYHLRRAYQGKNFNKIYPTLQQSIREKLEKEST